MCLALPGQVVEIHRDEPHVATVDVAGVKRNVNIGLLEEDPVRPGDWVLIHVGFAMSKISEAAAAELLGMLQALGEDEQTPEASAHHGAEVDRRAQQGGEFARLGGEDEHIV